MTLEELQKAVANKPVFVRISSVTIDPNAHIVHDVYGLVHSLHQTYDCRDGGYFDAYEALCDVMFDVTEITDPSGESSRIIGKVRFNELLCGNGTVDILQFLNDIQLCKPPKDVVKQITVDLKKQAIDAYARASTWSELTGEPSIGLSVM